ncbi:MAG TPA: type III-A CRISPR-associated protein Csm2, partial [Chloroflexi bacterium]|nr:type III-A CRISPR-associated protein Csm2 [Chloroflexota bacterium]
SLKDQGLSTNQIRALFGEVRQIQGEWSIAGHRDQALRRLFLLKPKMAYRQRKERGRAVQALVEVLDPALDLVTKAQPRPEGQAPGGADNQDDNFQRFVDFFEAILAYHKAYGGS